MKQQRYHSLDLLRAVMMFLGIILHGAQMYMAEIVADDYYLDPVRSVSMDAILITINTFRMPVFFLLSGFFIALLFDKRGFASMLENRLKRISLPFLILLPPLGLIMGFLTILGANWLETNSLGLDLKYIDKPFKLVDKTHNFWFLYYLTMHFLTAAALIIGYRFFAKKDEPPFRINPNSKHIFVAMLVMSLLIAIIGSYSESGRISADLSFMPTLEVYLYFGVFFSFGWCLYYTQWMINTFRDFCWTFMFIAVVTLIVGLVCFVLQGTPADVNYPTFHAILSLMNGFSVTFFIAAFVGIFQRYFSHYNQTYRYFSDSAYWVFCSHSAFLVALAIPMAHLSWHAELKFSIVVVGATYLCMLTYKHLVRSTWLGALLNGRKY